MSEKRYTVEEATALLPYLAPTLVELREKFEIAQKLRQETARVAARNGRVAREDRETELMARVEELLGRLLKWQIELRDLGSGLVDFPADREGEQVYLCWRLGEPDVAWWHPRETGFAGRRPISEL